MKNITLRAYRPSDLETVSELFYETIRSVNAKDYSNKQLAAWAGDKTRLKDRAEDLFTQTTLIAEIDGETVGFGSIDGSGYLDLLFVHKNFQRQGIATALCDALEQNFSEVKTYASVTAKPFFEKRGYRVLNERFPVRFGVTLKNYEMRKSMQKS